MDGLEATEVSYASLESVMDYRIESEYYSKKFLHIAQVLSRIDTVPFTEAAQAINGRPYSSEAFQLGDGIFVSKIGDVTKQRAVERWECVTREEFARQKGELLKDDDILMTLTGDPPDIGKVNMVVCGQEACTWNQRVAKIVRKNDIYRSNEVLYSVLQSDIVREQMERFAKGIRQRNLGNACFARVLLPVFSDAFQCVLEVCIRRYRKDLENAGHAYRAAEQRLLSQFHTDAFAGSEQSVSVRRFAEVRALGGRLDAEYYQPKYEDYTKLLCTEDTVETLCRIYDKSYLPQPEQEYRYIELANVGVYGDIHAAEVTVGKELPSRARRRVSAGQVIIASVEGSLQNCALITEAYAGALCSTGFFVLDSEVLNAETLLVLFKSEMIQALLKQRCSGTILTAITKEELLHMPLPRIAEDVQKQVAEHIQECFAFRASADRQLAIAKQAVETAVFHGEEKAMEQLEGSR